MTEQAQCQNSVLHMYWSFVDLIYFLFFFFFSPHSFQKENHTACLFLFSFIFFSSFWGVNAKTEIRNSSTLLYEGGPQSSSAMPSIPQTKKKKDITENIESLGKAASLIFHVKSIYRAWLKYVGFDTPPRLPPFDQMISLAVHCLDQVFSRCAGKETSSGSYQLFCGGAGTRKPSQEARVLYTGREANTAAIASHLLSDG